MIAVFYNKNKIMSKLNIKPLADRVLVEPLKAETKTASGIIIPDTAKEKPQKGNIVAVGPGTKEYQRFMEPQVSKVFKIQGL